MTQTLPVLCADIGGSFIDTALVQPDGTLHARSRLPTPIDDREAFLSALERIAASHEGVALHIAIAGLQDPQSGRCWAANIPCIDGAPLATWLAQRLRRPVRIGNDADCFALAEARLGAARGYRNVLGIILGTGVGGGLVIDGNLVTGPDGLAGEWGHGAIVPNVPGGEHLVPLFDCGCGQRGCIDTIGGARGLERLYRWCGGDEAYDSRAILDRWQGGEAVAARTLDLYLAYVSSALAMCVNLTGVGIVPVGGGLSQAPTLLSALDRATRARLLRRTESSLLVASQLRGDAGLMGAAFL